MLCIHPFSIHNIPGSQNFIKGILVYIGPLFHQIKMSLPAASGQIMPSALQKQLPVLRKGDSRIGSVTFFFHRQMPSGNLREPYLEQILISRLKTGAFQMRGPGILYQLHSLAQFFIPPKNLLQNFP